MKKLISVLLSFLMIFSFGIPAFAAKDERPTIYVTGAQTNDLYNAEGERIYPISDDIDAMEVIKNNLKPCMKKLILGLLTDNYEPYAKEFYNAFVPIYEDIALDKNGEASNGSHPRNNIYDVEIPQKTEDYGIWDYRFWYDWRISPMVAADQLKEYIEMVVDATGEEKVNLMGRCYGANVIAAYFTKYEDHAVKYVDDISFLSSSIIGIDMMSALFSGNMKFEDNVINNFVNFFMNKENIIEDETVSVFVLTLVELFNEIKVLGITGELLEDLVDKVKDDLIPPILRDTFGSMPAYWSMTTPESYEEAIEFVFGDCKEEYKNLIAKTDDYHYNVQLKIESTIKRLEQKGVKFNIFVKYNFPDYPIYEGATCQGDGTTAAVRQAFGGVYADFGEVLSNKYIETIENKNYLSPDKVIDASSCLLPNNTWFVKNIHHDIFPNELNRLAMDVMNLDVSVSDNVFPRFADYVDGKIVPLEADNADNVVSTKHPLATLMRFITAFFNLISKLLKNEITLFA